MHLRAWQCPCPWHASVMGGCACQPDTSRKCHPIFCRCQHLISHGKFAVLDTSSGRQTSNDGAPYTKTEKEARIQCTSRAQVSNWHWRGAGDVSVPEPTQRKGGEETMVGRAGPLKLLREWNGKGGRCNHSKEALRLTCPHCCSGGGHATGQWKSGTHAALALVTTKAVTGKLKHNSRVIASGKSSERGGSKKFSIADVANKGGWSGGSELCSFFHAAGPANTR